MSQPFQIPKTPSPRSDLTYRVHNLPKPNSPTPAFVRTAKEFLPGAPELFNHKSRTKMSSHSPRYFPDQLPAPTGIPIRAPPQDPKLTLLDEEYNKTSHAQLSSQGKGCGGYDELQDESRSKEAMAILEAHIKARVPYIGLASERLQAAVGVRNNSPFDLPELPKLSVTPSMQPLYAASNEVFVRSRNDRGGMNARSIARGAMKDNGGGFVPRSPTGLKAIDPKTGKGLREFLLQKGKECGMVKKECSSITFHDFTPEMRSGNHQNVLLGHYSIEKSERVDIYEIDLPATERNERGEEILTSERWLWILISRPMISLDPQDTSTFVAAKGSARTSAYSTPFHTLNSHKSQLASPEAESSNQTPPNFPHPTPLSWMVFAAPKAYVTTYPTTTENRDGSITPKEYPFATSSSKILKRTDYDFSFSGVPLFEFSCAQDFTTFKKHPEFLSIEQMGPWSQSDPYKAYTDEEYKRMYSLWEDGEWGVQSQRFDADGRPTAPMPSPNRGVWWKVFYERMAKDALRWKRVKNAMARGKCRVVVRWTEDDDEYMGGGGVAVGGRPISAKKGSGKRLTRSELRRSSALDTETPMGLAIGGVIGQSSSSRATGNLGRVVGAEQERTKIRKR